MRSGFIYFATDGHINNFHLIRHLAAIAVVLTHSYSIVSGQYESEPLVASLGRSIGHYAVDVFFVLSGFVVTQSLWKNNDLVRFSVSRVLRIFPALFLVVLATVFLLGPLVSGFGLADYFSDPALRQYLAGTLTTLSTNGALPGVFTNHPEAAVVNLPLWTLKYELAAYSVLAFVSVILLLTKRNIAWVILVAACLFYVLGRFVFPWPETESTISNLIHLLLAFFLGSFAFIYRRSIPLTPIAAVFLFFAAYMTAGTAAYEFIQTLFIVYAVLCLAFLPSLQTHGLAKFGDASYGIYIIAYPIQQTIYQISPQLTPVMLFAVSLAVVVPLALMSWHLFEKPIMGKRNQVTELCWRMIRLFWQSGDVEPSRQEIRSSADPKLKT